MMCTKLLGKKSYPSFLGGQLTFSKYLLLNKLLLIVIMGNYNIMMELIIEFPLCFCQYNLGHV